MEKQISFTRDEYRLYGMLHMPKQDLRGGVVFLHGFGGHRSEVGRLFTRCSRQLADQGIASLRFDFVGSGDSEGEYDQVSILSEVQDAGMAHQFFKANTRLETGSIGLVGYSLGGAVASLLTERVEVGSIVLWAPVSDPLRVFSEHLNISPDELLKRERYDHKPPHVGRKFIRELPIIRPVESMSHYTGELLAIHGSEDEVVLPDNSERLVESARSSARKVERILIQEAGHGFLTPGQSEELINHTVNWFDQYLNK